MEEARIVDKGVDGECKIDEVVESNGSFLCTSMYFGNLA